MADENKIKIVQEGALPHIITLMRSPQDSVIIQATGCLRNLSVHREIRPQICILHDGLCLTVGWGAAQNEFKIVQEGGIKPLVNLLRSPNYKVVEQAAVTLRNLSVNGTYFLVPAIYFNFNRCLQFVPHAYIFSSFFSCIRNLVLT